MTLFEPPIIRRLHFKIEIRHHQSLFQEWKQHLLYSPPLFTVVKISWQNLPQFELLFWVHNLQRIHPLPRISPTLNPTNKYWQAGRISILWLVMRDWGWVKGGQGKGHTGRGSWCVKGNRTERGGELRPKWLSVLWGMIDRNGRWNGLVPWEFKCGISGGFYYFRQTISYIAMLPNLPSFHSVPKNLRRDVKIYRLVRCWVTWCHDLTSYHWHKIRVLAS